MVFNTAALDSLMEQASVKTAMRLESIAFAVGSAPRTFPVAQVATHEYLLARWDAFYHDREAQYKTIADYVRTAYSDPRARIALHALSTHGHDWGHSLAGVPRRYSQDVLDDLLPLIKAISAELDAWYASAAPGKSRFGK